MALTLASRLQVAWQAESQARRWRSRKFLGLLPWALGHCCCWAPGPPRRYWVVSG